MRLTNTLSIVLLLTACSTLESRYSAQMRCGLDRNAQQTHLDNVTSEALISIAGTQNSPEIDLLWFAYPKEGIVLCSAPKPDKHLSPKGCGSIKWKFTKHYNSWALARNEDGSVGSLIVVCAD